MAAAPRIVVIVLLLMPVYCEVISATARVASAVLNCTAMPSPASMLPRYSVSMNSKMIANFRSGDRFGVGREAAKSQKSQANIAAAHQAGSLSRNILDEISSRLPFDRFERLKPSGPLPIRAVLRIGLRIVVPFARAPRASLEGEACLGVNAGQHQ